MTKEKIIINEIDVTECTYRRQNPHNFCMCASIINESGNIIELTRYVQCEYNPNCYYKQLKRKEQALDEIEKIISTPCISTINSCIECKCSSCLYKQVLNIINKVKEQK